MGLQPSSSESANGAFLILVRLGLLLLLFVLVLKAAAKNDDLGVKVVSVEGIKSNKTLRIYEEGILQIDFMVFVVVVAIRLADTMTAGIDITSEHQAPMIFEFSWREVVGVDLKRLKKYRVHVPTHRTPVTPEDRKPKT